MKTIIFQIDVFWRRFAIEKKPEWFISMYGE